MSYLHAINEVITFNEAIAFILASKMTQIMTLPLNRLQTYRYATLYERLPLNAGLSV